MTGMREQEVMFTYWSDVNFAASTVKVSHKPDRGWTPKAYKEREIPIPSKLAKSLKAWKAKSAQDCSLVFPTAGCSRSSTFSTASKPLLNARSSTRMASGFTSFAPLSLRGACGRVLICAQFSSGSVTPTWRARCGI